MRYVLTSSGRHTDGGGFDHVADSKSLDGLVLGCAARAVAAADGLDVATALLVATVGGSLLDHFGGVVCVVVGEKGKTGVSPFRR